MTFSRLLRAAVCAVVLTPAVVQGQGRVNDFVVTGGGSWESYNGNFSVVTVATVDSTEHVGAAVGEFGASGRINLLNRPLQWLDLTLDGGLRQFAATGFQLRDYAPREWASRVDATFGQTFTGLGTLTAQASYRGRSVEDRPPMPLFLQPGFQGVRASTLFVFRPIQNVSFSAQVDVDRTNYASPRLLPQLDMLDRKAQGFEIGALAAGSELWRVRFYSGLRWSHYEHQPTQVDDDPFRRDKTVNVGALWMMERWIGQQEDIPVIAEIGVEGTVNRSNSSRPEYDALSVTGDLFTQLPWWGLSTKLVSLIAWKTYVHETPYARLVPGEEADNGSVVHLDLIRDMAPNLTATLRFGWTRAEADIGNSYYRRFGTSLLFAFRPVAR
jgi:hypothetical protein